MTTSRRLPKTKQAAIRLLQAGPCRDFPTWVRQPGNPLEDGASWASVLAEFEATGGPADRVGAHWLTLIRSMMEQQLAFSPEDDLLAKAALLEPANRQALNHGGHLGSHATALHDWAEYHYQNGQEDVMASWLVATIRNDWTLALQVLLQHKISPNLPSDEEGVSCLLLAAKTGLVGTRVPVRLWGQAGADWHATTPDGETVLHLALTPQANWPALLAPSSAVQLCRVVPGTMWQQPDAAGNLPGDLLSTFLAAHSEVRIVPEIRQMAEQVAAQMAAWRPSQSVPKKARSIGHRL